MKLKFALVYPNIYNVGMCNLAIRLLYELINQREDVVCERFFFSNYGEIPRSLESGMPLNAFDVIGFSLQHEMDYVRMLDMIKSSGIPLESKNRSHPIIIAGGPSVTANPIPISPFIDFFIIGEVEPILNELLEILINLKNKEDLLSLPGIYQIGKPTEKIYVKNLDNAPHALRQIILEKENGFLSSFLLEISRGCNRRCRFCLESFLYSPKRDRSFKVIKNILETGLLLTNTNRVFCISSALLDHPQIKEILSYLVERKIVFSIPSLRIYDADEELMKLIASGGQRTLTIAPESPSERLREIINKNFPEDQLYNMIHNAKNVGIKSLKLYFMVGIPGEKDEDYENLDKIFSKIISLGFKPSSIHISINPLIPKANTPFQWLPLISKENYERKVDLFRKKALSFGIRRVECLDYRWSAIQAYLSTAGLEASKILMLLIDDITIRGPESLGSWRRVLKLFNKRPENIYIPKSIDQPLPWEEIKTSIPIKLLRSEFIKAIGDLQ
ncbi:MAG: radical SAM protein [Candidatus Methanomethylicaceae archaeon]|nr:radical SAM protein [Candidatus Verstraetearchaeota archaeon]